MRGPDPEIQILNEDISFFSFLDFKPSSISDASYPSSWQSQPGTLPDYHDNPHRANPTVITDTADTRISLRAFCGSVDAGTWDRWRPNSAPRRYKTRPLSHLHANCPPQNRSPSKLQTTLQAACPRSAQDGPAPCLGVRQREWRGCGQELSIWSAPNAFCLRTRTHTAYIERETSSARRPCHMSSRNSTPRRPTRLGLTRGLSVRRRDLVSGCSLV